MAQTKEGAQKIAAKQRGLSLEDYRAKLAAGLKWCVGCSSWHRKSAFGKDISRGDGLATECKEYRKRIRKSRYVPRPRKRGRRYVAARDGDKEQARGRVNHLVNVGVMPDPDKLKCDKCLHFGTDRRHEYHHHKGYAAEHHETVIVLCTTCHAEADGLSDRAKARQRGGGARFIRKEV